MLITAPLVPLFMIVVGKGAEKMSLKQWHKLSLMSAHFFDVIAGLTTLRQTNAARRQANIIAAISDSYRQTTMKVLRLAFLSSLVLEFLPPSAPRWSRYTSGSVCSTERWASCQGCLPYCWHRNFSARCAI
ncbi:ABC transporter transmembrane domain-containing protein [Pantoea rodasii]|uniref:ABC transporter transmembrane domain-containing protein n=1 Tax=Pantoea rodasii TaxID=1076549 RepID=UPI0024529EFB|nr:ABC transporter transmembrane domain-containing protein [Pantoea rodasii]